MQPPGEVPKDREQIARIVGRSALMDGKWEREDYRARTIDKALSDRYSTLPEHADTPLRVRSPDMANARPVTWPWHHRIPNGYLSLLLGEEGVGKGTLICWVIARFLVANSKATTTGSLSTSG